MNNEIFQKPRTYYEEREAIETAEEIAQQPRLWRELAETMQNRREEIGAFMNRAAEQQERRVIFTGAGSSAFVGEGMGNMLALEMGLLCETIHTTDIVATPDMTLLPRPTLLISYARSGESPESKAAITFAEQKIADLYQIMIVCEEESTLARMGQMSPNSLVLVMPKGSNDRGFAMTSSVSCMSIATWLLFHWKEMDTYANMVQEMAQCIEAGMDGLSKEAETIAQVEYRRLIWLGCGALRGLAREASVKSMELTDGYIHAGYDTPTGFRHGPKTVVDDTTMTVHFVSNQPYTACYDKDFIREMIAEQKANTIVTIKQKTEQNPEEAGNHEVLYELPDSLASGSEMGSYLSSLVFMQLLSMYKSLALGYTTDHPCRGGEVNRVVQGVRIHEW